MKHLPHALRFTTLLVLTCITAIVLASYAHGTIPFPGNYLFVYVVAAGWLIYFDGGIRKSHRRS